VLDWFSSWFRLEFLLKIKGSFFFYCLVVFVSLVSCGCGGKIASTGSAFVTDVNPNGIFRMQYEDGKLEWKRVNPDNPAEQTRIATRNRLNPARYVETKRGSTLTFADGKTINYFPLD
jgi:hypothetical protein